MSTVADLEAQRAIAFAKYTVGDLDPTPTPSWWLGADAREAFCFDLTSENPGDGSRLSERTAPSLVDDLRVARGLPDSAWLQARVAQTILERRSRGL